MLYAGFSTEAGVVQCIVYLSSTFFNLFCYHLLCCTYYEKSDDVFALPVTSTDDFYITRHIKQYLVYKLKFKKKNENFKFI